MDIGREGAGKERHVRNGFHGVDSKSKRAGTQQCKRGHNDKLGSYLLANFLDHQTNFLHGRAHVLRIMRCLMLVRGYWIHFRPV